MSRGHSAAATTINAPSYSPQRIETLREELIRTAAYFRAERRGFAPGGELADWLEAEREIDRWIETRGAPHRYRTASGEQHAGRRAAQRR